MLHATLHVEYAYFSAIYISYHVSMMSYCEWVMESSNMPRKEYFGRAALDWQSRSQPDR